jgi:hypothetical protein
MEARSLNEVRENIDRLDRAIIRLMAERGGFVEQAARFKTTRAEVEAPKPCGAGDRQSPGLATTFIRWGSPKRQSCAVARLLRVRLTECALCLSDCASNACFCLR